MQAIQTQSYGSSEVLEFVANVAQPSLKPGQVSIEVHAAGLNPFDLKVLSGAYQEMMPLQFPLIFGGDLAGKVLELGEGVVDLKVGDEVYGTAIALSGGSGSFAEIAAAQAQKIARKPRNTSFTEAAALPVAGLTAVEAIGDRLQVKKGQKVLIHGGAGGVGHLAIQYAKSLGAYVITTVGTADVEFAKSLGADQVIDYKTQTFETELSNLDAVLDTVGGKVSEKSYAVLKPGGTLVLLVSEINEALAKQHQVNAIRQSSDTDAPKLQRLAKLVEAGAVKVRLDRTFSLKEVQAAFAHLADGHPQGKVILKVR